MKTVITGELLAFMYFPFFKVRLVIQHCTDRIAILLDRQNRANDGVTYLSFIPTRETGFLPMIVLRNLARIAVSTVSPIQNYNKIMTMQGDLRRLTYLRL